MGKPTIEEIETRLKVLKSTKFNHASGNMLGVVGETNDLTALLKKMKLEKTTDRREIDLTPIGADRRTKKDRRGKDRPEESQS
ncbi:hypothetical protein K9N08_01545 [Candidatus Gracilibacteria bacterium]|nr:hypothetical protein [Candidatus Gracilibacteria bacterium]MCF7856224.1 hypothetical protein [Candidatus Gracilibacteria bacterium]MCF7896711.1 hypothetical protein [Candidatus Gracilibacteria bacterium]